RPVRTGSPRCRPSSGSARRATRLTNVRSTMKLGEQHEKEFIKAVIGRYADTAAADRFDDCVTIDLEKLCGVAGLPYLVYSMDHPSFIRRGLGPEDEHRFYGRWVAAAVC